MSLDTLPIEPRAKPSSLTFALVCLIATAALLALSTIFAKLAPRAGISATALLAWSVTGAAILLTAEMTIRRRLSALDKRTGRYLLIAAFFSLAGPNMVLFEAVPEVGASFVALALAMPPLLTYAGAVGLRMERFDWGRAGGVMLALSGTIILAWLKLNGDAPTFWIVAALVAPVLLAAGNIYRTLEWPEGAKPEDLSPGLMIAAAGMLVVAGAVLPSGDLTIPDQGSAWLIIALQAACFSLQYRLLFVLQRVGGPVLLSLLGAVAAIFTVPVSVVFLGESVPAGFVPAALLIALGIAMLASRQAART
jgi:drug/metabolite transporter (DMT)-like permease